MKYKLGDFVRFVDERREGYVTRIIDDQMIGVTDEDDFEIPVLASKVTSVYGHQPKVQTNQGTVQATAEVPVSEFKTKGVYLGVISDAKAASVVHFHLINDTSYQLLVTLTTERQQGFKGEFAGIIGPNSSADIYSAQLADIQLWPKFNLNILFHTTQNIAPATPIAFADKFKAKDFSGTKKVVPVLNQQGWLIRLDEPELVIDAEKLKESFYKPAEEKQKVDRPANEIDLHIEKLRNDYQFISSSDILRIQLEHFKKALDAAIVHQLPEIIFIHGAGNGILRHELHKQLGKHQKVQTFLDARKEKFGYGATKVILK
ncbi:Smr/MutS family protein [Mucilaginibacter lacusdianchii]|uniref:Smr/MutS family protein n=1 Tax=Mucilaginibacter lacusdianchii TaxID=2684211 RepID=UPI00131C0FFF|nr:Smr/MutS family protein [Mucilaginibacter sp. JXJ CY 39]